MIFGTVLTGTETKSKILENFLSKTLAKGKYTVMPKPQKLEEIGLKGIQEGFNI